MGNRNLTHDIGIFPEDVGEPGLHLVSIGRATAPACGNVGVGKDQIGGRDCDGVIGDRHGDSFRADSDPSTIAEAGEGNSLPGGSRELTRHFILPHATPVLGIEPVDGWRLWVHDEWDSDGFLATEHFARHAEQGDRALAVSRFHFTPSQDRFAWLVRRGFPPSPNAFGPWTDEEIEHAIREERIAA